jgi:hypothetical protein
MRVVGKGCWSGCLVRVVDEGERGWEGDINFRILIPEGRRVFISVSS